MVGVEAEYERRDDPLWAALDALPRLVRTLDDDSIEIFNRFGRAALDLRSARLLSDAHRGRAVEFSETGVVFPPLDVESTKESFESLCVRFRRLRTQNGDPQFGAVKNLLAKLVAQSDGTDADREAVLTWIESLHSGHGRLEREWLGGVVMGGGSVTPEEAMRLVFNGEVFHRKAPIIGELALLPGWQWMLVGFLYGQISAFSLLYSELAKGIDAVLDDATRERPSGL